MLSIAKGYDPDYLLNEVAKGAEHYYLKAIEVAGEPPGIWAGRGLEALGLEAGAEVDADEMRLLFKHWADPRKVAAAMEAAEAEVAAQGLTGARAAKFLKDAMAAAIEDARLGTAPYQFTPVEERLEAALAKEPYADERRRAEIERQVRKTQRQSVNFYDLTYNAPKSFSVLHAAFQVEAQQAEARGDTAGAELARWKAGQVWEAIMDGNRAQMEYLQDVAGYTRAGHHSKSIEGRTAGQYVKADGWIYASFRQHTNRNDDPHLHVHNPLFSKVKTVVKDLVTGEEKEVWRAVDGQALYRHLGAAGVHGDRVAGESLMRRVEGTRMEMRPDGKAREIVGIGQELRDQFSSRRRQVDAGVAELVKAYEEKHGRTPGVHQVAKMAQYVTLNSRAGKKKQAPTREQLLDRWESQATSELKQSLTGVGRRVVGGVFGRGPAQAQAFDPAEVTARAVRAIQAQKAKWTRADLRVEIDKALPDCLGGLTAEQVRGLVDELVESAVRPGKAQPVEVVSLMPPPVVELPEQMLAEASYDAAGIEKFATVEHLKREETIVEATRTAGAPVVDAEVVERVIKSAGLNEAQARAVRGITQSGRLADVLIGPAGTGKSRTVAALCEIWEQAGLPAPMGLATSQRAADVLREEGVERVANLSRFIWVNDRLAKGEFVPLAERQEYGVQRGGRVIVDEAGMADTNHIYKVLKVAERAGAQVLIAGDHGQVTAVGAGGMLHQLAGDAEPYILDEVVRFKAEWEKDASLRVRAGDASVLAIYERQGRIEDGSVEEMSELAYQRWLADHLDGKKSLLIASTNKTAGDLAMRARAELVRLKRVEPGGVELGLNEDVHQVAGVGDLVALRKNNRRMTAAGKKAHWATNRDVVTVVGRGQDGSLRVRYDDGATMTLPPAYVRQHVELAYAGTVHSAQGRTVETCHSLVAEGISREQLYVMLTRGRAANHAYVGAEPSGQKTPSGEYVIPDAHAILSDALARTEVEYSATTTLRREMDRAENLAVVGRMWEDLQIRVARPRYASALANAISEADWNRLYGTDSYESLIRLARHVDEQGFDAAFLLAETASGRSFAGVDDVGKVMYARLENAWKRGEQARVQAAKQAGTDGEPQRWRTYAERTPQVDGPEGEAMRQAAEVMDARRAELGRRAAEQAPAWAVEQLGAVPEDALEREEWVTRAGVVAGYREAHGYESERDAIGAAPPKGAVEARAAWEDAWRALGQPDERRDVARMSDLELQQVVERHERELSWAPANVDEDLKMAAKARDDARARATLRRAEMEVTTDPARRQELSEETTGLEAASRVTGTHAAQLEKVAKVYDRWHEHTRPVREQATMAREELDRRHPRPETDAPAEQAKPERGRQEQTAEQQPAARRNPAVEFRALLEAAERAARILQARERQAQLDAAREDAARDADYVRRQRAQQQQQAERIRGREID